MRRRWAGVAESIGFSRPAYLQDAEGFRGFLDLARIDALIVPNAIAARERVHPGVREALPSLQADPRVLTTVGETYTLIDLSALHTGKTSSP